VEHLKPPSLQPVLDIRLREPELNELRPAKDAVLPARHLENRPIQTTRGAFPLIINGNTPQTTSAVGITLLHCCL
jgi:hypothetical protein